MCDEEEDGYCLCRHSARYELCQNDFGSSMRQSTMSEDKVSQTIQVLHLDVCTS